MTKLAIQSTHKLEFHTSIWANPFKMLFPEYEDDVQWMVYHIGTMHGQYRIAETTIEILSFLNESPGNGHLHDAFEWFEYLSATENKPLVILECWNPGFKEHLISKRGFTPIPNTDDIIKTLAS